MIKIQFFLSYEAKNRKCPDLISLTLASKEPVGAVSIDV